MGQVLYGEGTLLSYGVNDPTTGVVPSSGTGAYAPLLGRVSISGPDYIVASVEKTTLDSVFKEFRPSNLPDMGSLEVKIYFDPEDDVHKSLLQLMAFHSQAYSKYPANVLSWQLEFNNRKTTNGHGTRITQDGFLTDYKVSGEEVDQNVAADLTIKLTPHVNASTGVGDTGFTITAAS